MAKDILKQIQSLTKQAVETIPYEYASDLPPDQFIKGVPAWHDFENEIWQIGETIRGLLNDQKSLRKDPELLKVFTQIATNPNAKRGRQSFVMLLGYKACQEYSTQVASQINDPHVSGHVIDTLSKMQASEYVDLVRPFANHEKTWIRNKAKKYLAKYAAA